MNWPEVKLEEIFDIVRGGSPRPISDYITEDVDGLNWISIKDASNSDKYITSTKLKIKKEGLKKSRLVKPGDFLLTNSMSFGRPYIMKTTGCIHDGWLALSGDPKRVDSDFFYYLLGSELLRSKFASLAKGAVVKNLNINLVKGVKIPLPPLPVQKQIAAVLEKADALRGQCQQMEKELMSLADSVFLDMFGDPIKNPKGWKTYSLEQVCSKITDGTHHSPTPKEGGVPYITAKHLKKTGLDFDLNPTFVSEEAHKGIYARCNPVKGDVLYIKDGATTGIAAINNYDFEFSMLSSLALIKPSEKLSNSYLLHWLNNELIKRIILREVAGAAITRLTLKKIKAIKINLPSLNDQKKYDEFLLSLKPTIESVKLYKDKAEQQFNALTQRAFKGELELKDVV